MYDVLYMMSWFFRIVKKNFVSALNLVQRKKIAKEGSGFQAFQTKAKRGTHSALLFRYGAWLSKGM